MAQFNSKWSYYEQALVDYANLNPTPLAFKPAWYFSPSKEHEIKSVADDPETCIPVLQIKTSREWSEFKITEI